MDPDLSSSLSIPQTQNTAPVLEFRCLYTPDLRRKQKRWQDGRLKFHTFNKRVMVYDERSNFVGDTHWKGSKFEEGEELELERGGILVEVGECVGKRDQDLFELVDKRVKEREERAAAKIAHSSPSRPQYGSANSWQLRPKTLNAVIGTPTGHYGRAMVSNLSPFDHKQQVTKDQNTEGRPVKRRKENGPLPSKSGYAQNLMGATLTLAATRPSTAAKIRYEPVRPSIQRSQVNMTEFTEDDGKALAQSNEIRKRELSKRSPLRIQKSKLKRASPSKSGYASSLLGAALALGKPVKTTWENQDTETINRSSARWDEDRSSSPYVDVSAREMDQNSRLRTRAPERGGLLDEVNLSWVPGRGLRAPVMQRPSRPVASNSITSLSPDRPVSALRIKARSPRKMMMLMDLPVSRYPARSESLNAGEITSNKTCTKTRVAHEVEFPRATKQTNKTCQTEEQPSIDFKDLSSLALDSGTDPGTIEALFSNQELSWETEAATPDLRQLPRESIHEIDEFLETEKLFMPDQGRAAGEEVLDLRDVSSAAAQPPVSSRIGELEPSPLTVNERKGTPKLANPATRGQPLQALANKTADMISSVITNIVPPPVPRYSGQSGGVFIRNGTGVNQSRGDPAGDGGPWSRESFDLFGRWKPAGKGMKITTSP